MHFLESHEWIKLEGVAAVIGISHHAQEQLSDVVFVDLPAVGAKIEAGKRFMAVESVKAASDIYAPVSGTVTAVNTALSDTPELVNQSPEADGWLVKITPVNAADIDKLMDRTAYDKTLQ